VFRFGSRFGYSTFSCSGFVGSGFAGSGFAGSGFWVRLRSSSASLVAGRHAVLSRPAGVSEGFWRLQVLDEARRLTQRSLGKLVVLDADFFGDVLFIDRIPKVIL